MAVIVIFYNNPLVYPCKCHLSPSVWSNKIIFILFNYTYFYANITSLCPLFLSAFLLLFLWIGGSCIQNFYFSKSNTNWKYLLESCFQNYTWVKVHKYLPLAASIIHMWIFIIDALNVGMVIFNLFLLISLFSGLWPCTDWAWLTPLSLCCWGTRYNFIILFRYVDFGDLMTPTWACTV